MARPGKILGFTGLGIALVILLALCGFGYFKYLWVFSDGTKTGELNSLTYTGYLFKTYEGEIILTGYGSKNASGTVQSKNFKFSVWRGYERAVVDSVEEETSLNSVPDESPLFL